MFLAGCFIAPQSGAIPRRLTSLKLQLVQNFAARSILGLRKYDHASASLRSLRWLNVCKQRLIVNDAVMMHKCLKGLSPTIMDKSLGMLLRFWGVFQFTQVQPLPSPHPTNNVGRVYPEKFFRLSTLYRVGEGELQENVSNAALF